MYKQATQEQCSWKVWKV